MIGVLDYGIGNIGSILNMLQKVGAQARAVTTAAEVSAAHKLILPGVGAFDQGMALLNQSGMREALDASVAAGKPVLGICLGMQMLGRRSEEGTADGLCYIPFDLKRFRLEDQPELKIPHMGWDFVDVRQPRDPLARDLEQPSRFYFVHTYHAVCDDPRDVLMTCDYGYPFAAAVRRGNVWGTQFHPEKSHRFGMRLLRNFAQLAPGESEAQAGFAACTGEPPLTEKTKPFHRPRLIPCLLLSQGNLVKTVRFKEPTYLGDPINAVKIFSEKCVDELCVQDIDASKEGRAPDFDLLGNMAGEAFMPLSYGGGITTLDQAARLFHIGFEKVVLNTALLEKPELITQIAERFGVQSVAASIDVRLDVFHRYRCVVKGGTLATGESPRALALKAQELGAGEILLNAVDRDGMMQGYDVKLVQTVADGLRIPLIACGGAKDAGDMARVLHEAGAHAAAAGSMFVYWGPLKAVLIHAPEEEELRRAGILP